MAAMPEKLEDQEVEFFPGDEEGEIIMEGDIPEYDDGYSPEELEELKKQYASTFKPRKEGSIIEGEILEVMEEEVIVDIGYKSEGLIPRNEFDDEVVVGEKVEVYLDALEDEEGQVVLSKRKADFLRVWDDIREAFENNSIVRGRIKHRIKGGMVVNLGGVEAFLPGSQIELRRVPDFDALVGEEMDFKILKLNRKRKNIVVSHRAILEEKRAAKRRELLSKIEEGDIVTGVVKNITDFGVFIDLGGMDGLLHITDMSWTRINHPSELVSISDELEVKVLKYDKEKERISLGLKQLVPSPWETVTAKYPVGSKVQGKVINITKYGAFVELEKGVEGLVHISEMSWTKHIEHPNQILKLGDIIDVVVLNIDQNNQKISLGIKQLETDPWEIIDQKYPVGAKVTGKVRSLTSFGVFVELEEGIDGLIHISDLSWTKRIMHPSEILHKGQEVDVIVLDIDKEKHRISLGYKQLARDPWPELAGNFGVGAETKGKIIRMTDRGVTVILPGEVEGFVPVTQLGKEVNKPEDAFENGELLPLKVLEFDPQDHRIVLSVTAYFESRREEDLHRYMTSHPIKTQKMEDIAVTKVVSDRDDFEDDEKAQESEEVEEDIPEEEETDTEQE
ncbi:MAG: 30S ribosomal protein S1 [Candidatus Zixiibacteriota bacterium]